MRLASFRKAARTSVKNWLMVSTSLVMRVTSRPTGWRERKAMERVEVWRKSSILMSFMIFWPIRLAR